MKRKAQSEVIATVLLILLTIAAVAVISAFLIPFLNKKISEGKCFDYSNKIMILDNPKYTCYDSADGKLLVQTKVGDLDEKSEIKSLMILVQEQGVTKNFEIIPGTSNPNILMYDGNPVNLPNKNEARTYNITGISIPTAVHVYPIIPNDIKCTNVIYTTYNIPNC